MPIINLGQIVNHAYIENGLSYIDGTGDSLKYILYSRKDGADYKTEGWLSNITDGVSVDVFDVPGGRPSAVGAIWHSNGLVYFITASSGDTPGYLSKYDPATGIITTINALTDPQGGYYMREGDDGKLYIGECTKGYLEYYDPDTDTFTTYGIVADPGAPYYRYIYSLGCDGTWAYCAIRDSSHSPLWRLVAIDLTEDYPDGETIYLAGSSGITVVLGSDDVYYAVIDDIYYSLIDGVVTLASAPASTKYPQWPPTYTAGSIPYRFDVTNAYPQGTGTTDSVSLGYQPTGGGAWNTVSETLKCSCGSIMRLNLSEDGTYFLGWTEFYGPFFKHEIATGITTIYQNPKGGNYYCAANNGDIWMASGYSVNDAIVYDASATWTLNWQSYDPYDDTSWNPFKVLMDSHTGTYLYHCVYGGDGYYYFGCHYERYGELGGSIAWYNPTTEDTEAIRTGVFENYDCQEFIKVGSKIVYSSNHISSGDAKLFVFDIATQSIDSSFVPIAGKTNAGKIVHISGNTILGIIYDTDSTYTVYTADIVTQDITTYSKSGQAFGSTESYHRKVVLGPDGYAWLFVGNDVCRINPSTGSVEVVNSFADSGRLAFAGNDLYVYMVDANLYKVTNIMSSSTIWKDGQPVILGLSGPDVVWKDGQPFLNKGLFSFPIVTTTSPATDITDDAATCAGNVTDDGGGTISERGIAYGESENPTIAGSHESVAGTTGTFEADLTGLDPETTYHFRAFATNEAGTAYGSDETFDTLSAVLAPTVTTGVTTLITANSATCAGNVTDDGGSAITERGIAYGTSINPTIAGTHEAVAGTTGAFTADLSGLDNFTTYHYRAYATNEIGTSYGTDQTFVTGDIVSIVSPNRTASIIGICARYNNATPYGLVDLRYNNPSDKFFSWDNNQILWTKSQQQRCRQLRNSKWINTRYMWSTVTRTDGYTSLGVPVRAWLENEWTVTKGRELEDMYVHTTVPEAEGNRAQWTGDGLAFDYIKFADPDMLDILFGAEGAEGAGSWVEYYYPTLFKVGQIDPADYYGHDVFASYGYLNNGYPEPPTGQESEYGYSTSNLIGHRWYEYLSAFKTRILDPLGRKLIVNMAQCRHTHVVGGLPTVDYIDTDFAELFDGVFVEDPLSKSKAWDETLDYNWGAGELLTFSSTLLAADKSIASAYGETQIHGLRLYNKGSVGARSFQVSSKYLKLEQQDDSILSIDLTAQTSLAALRTLINAQSDSFTAEVYGDSSNASGATWFTDAIPNLREVAATDVDEGAWTTFTTTAPISPKLQTAPRQYLMMQMAYFLLLGIRETDKVYVGLSQGVKDAMSAGTPCHSDIHDALSLLGEPDSGQTTWEKVNEAWGDVYYRLYENGVVFFNWEAIATSARTINVTDFSQTKWYRLTDNHYTPGESWQETNSISLAPKHGEICIFSIG